MTHLLPGRLARYADDDLPAPQRAEADAHLRGCSACRTEVVRLRGLAADLSALPLPEPPAHFATDVLAALFPRPSFEQIFMRLAARASVAYMAILALLLGTTLGVFGPLRVARLAATALVRGLETTLSAVGGLFTGLLDLLRTAADLASLADAMGATARGLETAVLSLSPQVVTLFGLTVALAMLVLVWATSPVRERGVPHVSLSL